MLDKKDQGRICRTPRPLSPMIHTASGTENMACKFMQSQTNLPPCRKSNCILLKSSFRHLNSLTGRYSILDQAERREISVDYSQLVNYYLEHWYSSFIE